MAVLFSPKIIVIKTQVVHARKLVWCSTFVNNFMPKILQAERDCRYVQTHSIFCDKLLVYFY